MKIHENTTGHLKLKETEWSVCTSKKTFMAAESKFKLKTEIQQKNHTVLIVANKFNTVMF